MLFIVILVLFICISFLWTNWFHDHYRRLGLVETCFDDLAKGLVCFNTCLGIFGSTCLSIGSCVIGCSLAATKEWLVKEITIVSQKLRGRVPEENDDRTARENVVGSIEDGATTKPEVEPPLWHTYDTIDIL